VGFKCRFLGAHLERRPSSSTTGMDAEGGGREGIEMPDLILRTDPEKIEWAKMNTVEMNGVSSEVLKSLRKREVCPIQSDSGNLTDEWVLIVPFRPLQTLHGDFKGKRRGIYGVCAEDCLKQTL
jgi:hypothetical protein